MLRKFYGEHSLRQLITIAIAHGVTMQRSYGIKAGKNLAVNRGTLIDGKDEVEIGDNVLIEPYVIITTAQHSFEQADVPIIMQPEKKARVIIGNDVWIGTHVRLIKNIP